MAPGQVRCGQCQTPAARLREVAGKSADLLRSLRPGRCTTVVANWCPSCANWVRPERFDWPANACVYCLSVKRAGAVA